MNDLNDSAVRDAPAIGRGEVALAHVATALDHADLDALDDGVIELDGAGRVVRYNAAEATRVGVSRWQVLGRDYARELGWTVGAEVVDAIERFRRARANLIARVRGNVRRRDGAAPVEVMLLRGQIDHVYVVVARSNPRAGRDVGQVDGAPAPRRRP